MRGKKWQVFESEFTKYSKTVLLPQELKQAWVQLNAPPLDLTGQQFHYLTTIRKEGMNWICRCRCGKETSVRTQHLKSGRVKSCGCYRRELLIERHEQHRLNA